MPSENIGDCGTAQFPDKHWIIAELELGICYIRHACGSPPPGYELGIIWHEHDLGEYASIGVTWDGPKDAPWEYIARAETALSRFDDAVAWSELKPEPEEEWEDEDEDEPDDPDEDVSESDPIELYRREEMVEADQKDWHMALLIFQEMGWLPVRPLETYDHPLMFVTDDEGKSMQRAGRSLFAVIQDEPFVSASVQMDLGLFHNLTEFVGGGAFIVGRPGSYEDARQNDFPKTDMPDVPR